MRICDCCGQADPLLTKKELAAVIQCSERHIERLQHNRKIPFVKISGKLIRYSRASVMRAIAEMETKERTA